MDQQDLMPEDERLSQSEQPDVTAAPEQEDHLEKVASLDIPQKPIERVKEYLRDKVAARNYADKLSAAAARAEREYQPVSRRPEDYQSDAEFVAALTADQLAQREREQLKRAAEVAYADSEQAAHRAWSEATRPFAERIKDYDETVHNPDLDITPVMADALRHSNEGPSIIYYLGKNPREATRISQLPLIDQALEIARLEARISRPREKVSEAPPPVETVGSRRGGQVQRYEKMSHEQYRRARGY